MALHQHDNSDQGENRQPKRREQGDEPETETGADREHRDPDHREEGDAGRQEAADDQRQRQELPRDNRQRDNQENFQESFSVTKTRQVRESCSDRKNFLASVRVDLNRKAGKCGQRTNGPPFPLVPWLEGRAPSRPWMQL